MRTIAVVTKSFSDSNRVVVFRYDHSHTISFTYFVNHWYSMNHRHRQSQLLELEASVHRMRTPAPQRPAKNAIKRYFSCRQANDKLSVPAVSVAQRDPGVRRWQTFDEPRAWQMTEHRTSDADAEADAHKTALYGRMDDALRRSADLWQEDKLRRFKAITRQQPA